MADQPPFPRDFTAVIEGRGGRLILSPQLARWLDLLRYRTDISASATGDGSFAPTGNYPAAGEVAVFASYAVGADQPVFADYETERDAGVSAQYPSECPVTIQAEYTP